MLGVIPRDVTSGTRCRRKPKTGSDDCEPICGRRGIARNEEGHCWHGAWGGEGDCVRSASLKASHRHVSSFMWHTAMLVKPLLITVDQYRELSRREDVIQELHWGRVVNLSFPKLGHKKLQEHLVDLLRPRAQGKGVVFGRGGIPSGSGIRSSRGGCRVCIARAMEYGRR